MVSKSDCVTVFSKYRLYRRAETLLTAIKSRRDWYTANELEPVHGFGRYLDVEMDLRDFIAFMDLHSSRLDNNAIIQDAPKCLGMRVRDVMDWIFEGLPQPGAAQLTQLEKTLTEQMSERARGAIASGHAFDLANEIVYRTNQQWFMIFGTLTVAPENYSKVFSKGSLAWQEYIDKVDNRIAQAYAGSVRKARLLGSDYHSYFAVVEKGGQTGRLHIHVLHMCKVLPTGTEDPNYGLNKPVKREIVSLRSCWEHGYTSHIAVRYGDNDPYGQLGWRWPMDPKSGVGIPAKGPLAVSGYITKYINKSFNAKQEDFVWRVRKSRSLGRQIVRQLLSHLTTEEMKILATLNILRVNLNGKLVPRKVINQECLRLLQARLSSSDLWSLAVESDTHPSLLQRTRDLTQKKPESSSLSIGLSQTAALPKKAISDLANKLLILGAQYTDEYYKPSAVRGARIAVRSSGAYASGKGNRQT